MTDALFDNQDVNPNLGVAVYVGGRSISVDETLLELLGFGSIKACEVHYPEIWSHGVAEQPPAELDDRALDSIRALQRENQPDILEAVTKLYMEHSPVIIDVLVDAATRLDANGATVAARTLKLSSVNVGATKLAELCRRAELKANRGDLDNLLSEVQTGFDSVCLALEVECTRATHADPHS